MDLGQPTSDARRGLGDQSDQLVKVDDRQAPVTQRDPVRGVDPGATVVRAPVVDPPRHGTDCRRGSLR